MSELGKEATSQRTYPRYLRQLSDEALTFHHQAEAFRYQLREQMRAEELAARGMDADICATCHTPTYASEGFPARVVRALTRAGMEPVPLCRSCKQRLHKQVTRKGETWLN